MLVLCDRPLINKYSFFVSQKLQHEICNHICFNNKMMACYSLVTFKSFIQSLNRCWGVIV